MNDSQPIFEIRDVQVIRAGSLVLDIPALMIEKGEILSLVGPNGAGKTTFLQTLACLIKPSRGECIFKGEKVSPDHSGLEYRRRVAMVFQEPLLFDTTVFENVASGLKIRGMPGPEIQEIVSENLERFGIAHLPDRSARKISGGEAQRVALARAFATRPEILLLDEPFASLDPPTRECLLEDLESILRQTKTTTLMATHDRMEALRLSDRVAVMNQGRILQVGRPAEVMNHPIDEFVASFMGVDTILTGRVIKKDNGSFIASIMGKEVVAVGEIELGESVVFCIRPENVTLATDPFQDSSSARNIFSGRIVKVIHLGLYHKVQLHCGFPLVAHVTTQSLENLSLTEGKEVFASFKATSIHVLRKRGERPSIASPQSF